MSLLPMARKAESRRASEERSHASCAPCTPHRPRCRGQTKAQTTGPPARAATASGAWSDRRRSNARNQTRRVFPESEAPLGSAAAAAGAASVCVFIAWAAAAEKTCWRISLTGAFSVIDVWHSDESVCPASVLSSEGRCPASTSGEELAAPCTAVAAPRSLSSGSWLRGAPVCRSDCAVARMRFAGGPVNGDVEASSDSARRTRRCTASQSAALTTAVSTSTSTAAAAYCCRMRAVISSAAGTEKRYSSERYTPDQGLKRMFAMSRLEGTKMEP
mmetsp:Transcript_35505/g.68323  ORF Transcript_35505/g.68323 Transcript_35505/m.68323 type:complete len:274 (-) Transcript_35505:186-1007(-)